MLKQRITTAILVLPLYLWMVYSGPEVLNAAFMSAFVFLSVREAVRILLPGLSERVMPDKPISKKELHWWSLQTALLGSGVFLLSLVSSPEYLRGGIAVFFALTMLLAFFTGPSLESSMVRALVTFWSLAYGCLPFFAIWELWSLDEGGRFLFLLLAIVMGNDTFAYFGGKAFGRKKLAPQISPGKTWEGAFFGMVGSVLCAFSLDLFYDGGLTTPFVLVLCGVLGGFAGILGDLVESAMKRFAGVKDSGRILPGHGGFLDRADAALFAAPVIWGLLAWFHT